MKIICTWGREIENVLKNIQQHCFLYIKAEEAKLASHYLKLQRSLIKVILPT